MHCATACSSVPLYFMICTHFLSVVLHVVLPKSKSNQDLEALLSLVLAKCSAAVARDEDSHGVRDYRWYSGFCVVPSDTFVLVASRGPTHVERKEVILQERDVMGAAVVPVLVPRGAQSFLSQQCHRGR